MKFRALLILGLMFLTSQLFAGEIVKADTVTKEPASKKEIVKTGYNFGPLPAIAFDADKGFQLGALLNIYDFGDGSTYPNPRQQWYFEASFFTKGSQLYVISYDNKFSIPGVRFSTALVADADFREDFFNWLIETFPTFSIFHKKEKKNKK